MTKRISKREADAMDYLRRVGSVLIQTTAPAFWDCLVSLQTKGLVRFEGGRAYRDQDDADRDADGSRAVIVVRPAAAEGDAT